jgi:MFS superfamily sulfate permease-like transporter
MVGASAWPWALRVGGLADFLSKPILVGCANGAALVLVASQPETFFGQTSALCDLGIYSCGGAGRRHKQKDSTHATSRHGA